MNFKSQIILLFAILLCTIDTKAFSKKILDAAPVAICQNFSIPLDATGQATILTSDIDNGSTGCSVLSYSLDISTFTCANIGNNTVTLTVMDANGMTDFCTATVTISDPIAPTPLCKTATLALDANGLSTLTVADVDNGSTDACGLSYITLSKTNFNCSNVGANTVVLSMSDNNGNLANCSATVNIIDNMPPTAQCIAGPIQVTLDAAGLASITTSDVDNASFDNCGIASLALDKTNFDCTDLGINTVELSVTDVNGNVSKCTTTVEVLDQMGPVAICKDTVLVLSVGGNATLIAAQLDNGSTDNCTSPTFSLGQSSFDCTDIGSNIIVFTVTDANGNSSTCNSVVTVEDHTPPTPVCQNKIITLDVGGMATITTADIDNGTIDECVLDTLILDKYNFSCLDIGANTVTMTAIDQSGNSATCTATVTVQDNIAPIANCISSFTVQLDNNMLATVSTFDINNNSFDTCGINMMTLDQTTFDCTDVGSNPVTLTVVDNAGLSATCNSVVNVLDNFNPVATCSNQILYLDATGNGIIAASDIDNVSGNACSFSSMTLNNTIFDCSDLGTNPVTLTVEDTNGNTSTCNALVTVRDTIAPFAISQNIIVHLDVNGNATVAAAQINNNSTDACGINSISLNETSFDCSEIGTNSVTLSVVDNSGNSGTTTANVIVMDTIPPIALCQNISVMLGQGGSASVSASLVDNGSSDACGISNMTLNKSTFLCSDLGTNTVTLTVTDNNGNTSFCNAVITVLDNVTPIAVCGNVSMDIGSIGSNDLWPSDIDAGSIGACSGFELTVSQSAFDCSDLGINYVVLTNENLLNGNDSSCISIVEVFDNTAPIAICKDDTLTLNNSGIANLTAAQLDNGSSDVCGITNMTIDQTNFDCSHLGVNSVKFKVIDSSGNADSCYANVTIVDAFRPTAVCQNISVSLGANGTVSITPSMIGSLSSDNCSISNMSLDQTTFNASHVGTNTVNLLVEDPSGNSDNCSAFVTVMNGNQPIAICQNISVQLDNSGNASILASDLDNGSIVANGNPMFTVSASNFDCNDVGAQTVTLTVTDSNGNTSNCNSIVNVMPSAICNNSGQTAIFVERSGNDPLANVIVDINGVGVMTDNQGMASFANIPTSTSYTITPNKNTNPLNGVTTYDLVLIQGYILQTQSLTPYQEIAADINANGVVSTFDMVQLRSMILYITLDFPNNTSWRFVDNSHVFPASNPPNVAPYPESITTTSVTQGLMSFTGVKVGDLNLSANTSLFSETNNRSETKMELVTEDQKFVAGEKIKIDFKTNSIAALSAMQFTFNFDKDVLEFIESNNKTMGSQNLFFNEQYSNKGILTAAYYNLDPIQFSEENILFSLEFMAKQKGSLSEQIQISSELTDAQAFSIDGKSIDLELIVKEANELESTLEFISNNPNPFKEQTSILFNSNVAQEIQLKIFTPDGKVIKNYKKNCTKGFNEIIISKDDLKNSGIYFYQISNGKKTIVRKMILI